MKSHSVIATYLDPRLKRERRPDFVKMLKIEINEQSTGSHIEEFFNKDDVDIIVTDIAQFEIDLFHNNITECHLSILNRAKLKTYNHTFSLISGGKHR